MKTLPLFLCAILLATTIDAAEQRARQTTSRNIEIITPGSPNIFARTSGAPLIVVTGATANVFAGRSTNLHTVALTNGRTPANSLLIGPVFPAPVTNLAPTGRSTGFEGRGPAPAPLLTNALGQVATNSLIGSQVPAPATPRQAPNTTPLAPPTAPNIPQPTTPSAPSPGNAPPNVPSSPNPAPPNFAPLAPPSGQAAPTPPAPPPAAPGGTGAR